MSSSVGLVAQCRSSSTSTRPAVVRRRASMSHDVVASNSRCSSDAGSDATGVRQAGDAVGRGRAASRRQLAGQPARGPCGVGVGDVVPVERLDERLVRRAEALVAAAVEDEAPPSADAAGPARPRCGSCRRRARRRAARCGGAARACAASARRAGRAARSRPDVGRAGHRSSSAAGNGTRAVAVAAAPCRRAAPRSPGVAGTGSGRPFSSRSPMGSKTNPPRPRARARTSSAARISPAVADGAQPAGLDHRHAEHVVVLDAARRRSTGRRGR